MRTLYTLALGAFLSLGCFSPALVRAAEPEYAAALDKRISVEFAETPFVEAVAQLAQEAGVRIVLDPEVFQWGRFRGDQPQWRKAHELSLRDERAPVWLKAKGITMISALQLLLGQFDLVYQLREEHLEITSRKKARDFQLTRVYQVPDLLWDSELLPPGLQDHLMSGHYLDLRDMLDSVWPGYWAWRYGNGSCMQLGSGLQVTQSDPQQRQVKALIDALRQAAARATKSVPASQAHRPIPITDNLNGALEEPIDEWELFKSPLTDAIEYIANQTALPLYLDRPALAAREISDDSPVTISIARVPAGDALRELLKPLKLTFQVHHDLVIIAPASDDHENLENSLGQSVVVYPVADLYAPLPGCGGLSSKELIDAVRMIEGGSWDLVGGEEGTLGFFHPTKCLVVRHRLDVQRQVADLLAELRKSVKPVSAEQQASRMQAWNSELVWQGFRWQDTFTTYWQPPVIGGGSFGFPDRDQLAEFQKFEPRATKPAAAMTQHEKSALNQVIDLALEKLTLEAEPIVLSREHEILIGLPRAAMISLEKSLAEAPVMTMKASHWQPFRPYKPEILELDFDSHPVVK